jgi:hypothetical protein
MDGSHYSVSIINRAFRIAEPMLAPLPDSADLVTEFPTFRDTFGSHVAGGGAISQINDPVPGDPGPLPKGRTLAPQFLN